VYARWVKQKAIIWFFTRKTYKTDAQPSMINGQTVEPQGHVKILGVVMDARLKYKEHIWRAESRGLEAAMELRHLGGLSTSTARQLFTSTVVPVVDYASNVWMHAFISPPHKIDSGNGPSNYGRTFTHCQTPTHYAEAFLGCETLTNTARHSTRWQSHFEA